MRWFALVVIFAVFALGVLYVWLDFSELLRKAGGEGEEATS